MVRTNNYVRDNNRNSNNNGKKDKNPVIKILVITFVLIVAVVLAVLIGKSYIYSTNNNNEQEEIIMSDGTSAKIVSEDVIDLTNMEKGDDKMIYEEIASGDVEDKDIGEVIENFATNEDSANKKVGSSDAKKQATNSGKDNSKSASKANKYSDNIVNDPALKDKKQTTKSSAIIYNAQIGAFSDRVSAVTSWDKISASYPEIFRGLNYYIEEVKVSGKTFYRLKAGPFSGMVKAQKFCDSLKAKKHDCFIVKAF